MTNEVSLKGCVFNYKLEEGRLILNIAVQKTPDKTDFLGYEIDTNDEKNFQRFCEKMLLYNREAQVILDYLPETKVIIEAVEAGGCTLVTALQLDLDSYQ